MREIVDGAEQEEIKSATLAEINGRTGDSSIFGRALTELDRLSALVRMGTLQGDDIGKYVDVVNDLQESLGQSGFIEVYNAWNRARGVRFRSDAPM